jgi:alginate O-acetyltransferase complex protein AlgI
MLFNSTDFLIFFGLFLAVYWGVRRSLGARNGLVVVASYVFYGWWDYRFLGLLALTSVLDFIVGIRMEQSRGEVGRKVWLIASVSVNLAVLFAFKYFDFFQESLEALLAAFGLPLRGRGLHLILPVGISFYTFQSMSYAIDVYRRHVPACRSLVQFLAYVAFFPQLVAGPIERATALLPQFQRTLRVDAARLESGLGLAVWGFFKKVVLADQLAPLVELVFQHDTSTAPMIGLGTIAFALQIYGDFSGYSDIARGVARILGFELTLNFRQPLFAVGVQDFWRRWHISLSSWLRDYLYVPLGGNRRGAGRTYLNLFLTMLLGGLWHGAAVNFVLWGLWHGSGLALQRWAHAHLRWRMPTGAAWGLTTLFVLYGWLLFRGGSPERLFALHAGLLHWTLPAWWTTYAWNLLVLAAPLLTVEAWQQWTGNPEVLGTIPRWARALVQGTLIGCVALCWDRDGSPFIYFQF